MPQNNPFSMPHAGAPAARSKPLLTALRAAARRAPATFRLRCQGADEQCTGNASACSYRPGRGGGGLLAGPGLPDLAGASRAVAACLMAAPARVYHRAARSL